MNNSVTLEKIETLLEDFENLKQKDKILAIHPSILHKFKNYTTYYHKPFPLERIGAIVFRYNKFSIEILLSFKLPEHHYCLCTREEYEEKLK